MHNWLFVVLWSLLRIAQALDDNVEWTEALSGLFPFLIASFFIIFSLHVILFPQLATRTLMKEYLEQGVSIDGKVLSCATKAGSGGDAFVCEIGYEIREHKYRDNPSLKFRNPEAFETKHLVRRFEFDRELPRGQAVEVLIPPTPNCTRSGMPRVVVEKLLNELSTQRVLMILIPGLILLAVSIAMAVRAVLLMENAALGWGVLLGSLCLSELVSFLFSADAFFKSKRRRFDSARPFVSSEAQAAANAQASQISREQLLDPYSISLLDTHASQKRQPVLCESDKANFERSGRLVARGDGSHVHTTTDEQTFRTPAWILASQRFSRLTVTRQLHFFPAFVSFL